MQESWSPLSAERLQTLCDETRKTFLIGPVSEKTNNLGSDKV